MNKRIISILLVLMMLFNLSAQNLSVFAETDETKVAETQEESEEAVKTASGESIKAEEKKGEVLFRKANTQYTFEDGPVGEDVTDLLTIDKLNVYVSDTSPRFEDGVVKGGGVIEHWHEVLFHYFWHIDKASMDTQRVKAGSYFVLEGPKLSDFKGKTTGFNKEYNLDNPDGGVFGKFKLVPEGDTIKIVAKFNDQVDGKKEITDGYIKVWLGLAQSGKNARINGPESVKEKGKLVIELYTPEVKEVGHGYSESRKIIKKEGYRDSIQLDGKQVTRMLWQIEVNLDQQKKMLEEGVDAFEERNDVWVEDELGDESSKFNYAGIGTANGIRLLPRMFTITYPGYPKKPDYNTKKMSDAVLHWHAFNVTKVHQANVGESYEDFKQRLENEKNTPNGIKPFEAAVYPNEAEKDLPGVKTRILVYLGNLDKNTNPKPKEFNFAWYKRNLDYSVNEGRLVRDSQRYWDTLEAYTTYKRDGSVPESEAKLKPILFYVVQISTIHEQEDANTSNTGRVRWENSQVYEDTIVRGTISAEGGAKADDVVKLIISKKWEGKQGGELTFVFTGDDTSEVVEEPAGSGTFVEKAKEATKHELVIPAGKLQASEVVLKNKSILDGNKKKLVPINFTVTEKMTEEDKAKYQLVGKIARKDNSYVFEATNRNIETVNVKVNKSWVNNDSDNQSVEVEFFDSRDTNFKNPVKPLGDDGVTELADSKVSLSEVANVKLPKYHRGNSYPTDAEVQYVIKEVASDKYAQVGDATYDYADMDNQVANLTNVINVEIPVKKVWRSKDAQNPTAVIKVINKKTGDVVGTFETNTDGTKVFRLPKYDANQALIEYEVKEEALAKYTSKYTKESMNGKDGHVFTNFQVHDLKIQKVWRDNNVEALRTDVVLTLHYKNHPTNESFDNNKYVDQDTQIVAVITKDNAEQTIKPDNTDGFVKFTLPKEAKDGIITIKNLPYKDAAGKDLYFSVREGNVENYLPCVVCVDGGQHESKTLYNLKSIPLTLEKKWVGAKEDQKTDVVLTLKNGDNKLSANIVDVIAKANAGKVSVVNGEVQVTIRKTGTSIELKVPEYDTAGNRIEYKVVETKIPGFAIHYGDRTDNNTITVTNTNENHTREITVTKKWKHPLGTPEQKVTLTLKNDSGLPEHVVQLPKEEGGKKVWNHTFKNLRTYNNKGEEIKYEVEETGKPAGYNTPSYSGDMKDGLIVTNTIVGQASISVNKKWLGDRTVPSVTVALFYKGGAQIGEAVELKEGKWNHTFVTSQYDKDGNPYEFEVKELKVGDQVVVNGKTDSYEVTVTQKGKDFEIVNFNTEKIEIPVTKTWVGAPADKVEFELYADGKKVDGAKVTLTKPTDAAKDGIQTWEGKFTDLPKFDKNNKGKLINYTVEEVALVGYALTRNANVFTNTNTEKISVNVKKEWLGEGARADKVVINLFRDGIKQGSIELTEAKGWKGEFTDLLKYNPATGKEYVYTVTENEIVRYKVDITGDVQSGFVVTNTYIPPSEPYNPGGNTPPTPQTPPTPDKPNNPSDTPEKPTTPPTTDIPEAPVPEGSTTPPTPPTAVLPTASETPLEDDTIPKGKAELPKTDGIPAGILYLMGLGLAGLGGLLKRKNK